jgi:cytochrome c oxidase subunit IV
MATAKQTKADGHHGNGHHGDDHAHGHIGPATYYKVFAALMLLMFLTVGAWWLEGVVEIPRLLGVIIALMIASTKTALIVLFFMHIKISSRITQLYAAVSLVGLLFLFVIIMGDYFARGWPPQLGPLP